jgi:hypothetical protein
MNETRRTETGAPGFDPVEHVASLGGGSLAGGTLPSWF